MGRAHGNGLKRQTNNQFLNMYEVDAVRRDGVHFPYYVATRRQPGDLMYETGQLRPDGVVIYPVYRRDPEKLVVIRQFRYPVNAYMYEVPAGLIDAGEDPIEAAVREMKEETGLDFEAFREYDPSLLRPFVQSQGMSDECDVTVFGYADGEITGRAQEVTEDIEIFLADRHEIKRILREELVSLRAAYLFLAFLNSDPKAPFEFLKI